MSSKGIRKQIPNRILVLSNLFPPQELGGYGRKMWEFAWGLQCRGHTITVLTANEPKFGKTPTSIELEMEKVTHRCFHLLGGWRNGKPYLINSHTELENLRKHNITTLHSHIASTQPDAILLGNLTFLGVELLNSALQTNLPVLHALGNPKPAYTPQEQPNSPHYCIGGASQFCVDQLKASGYDRVRTTVLFPGALTDFFFRANLPSPAPLRICFAGLVLPFKGPHILLASLIKLSKKNIDFHAEFAGDSLDEDFIYHLRTECEKNSIADRVKFLGFQDRNQLKAMYSRSNVLVFPSLVPEMFGISQVEAMASGLVVVSSGTGGAREIIQHDIDGLLYTKDSPTELAACLERLSFDSELFIRLQRRGQTKALNFSVDRSIDTIEDTFDKISRSIKCGSRQI